MKSVRAEEHQWLLFLYHSSGTLQRKPEDQEACKPDADCENNEQEQDKSIQPCFPCQSKIHYLAVEARLREQMSQEGFVSHRRRRAALAESASKAAEAFGYHHPGIAGLVYEVVNMTARPGYHYGCWMASTNHIASKHLRNPQLCQKFSWRKVGSLADTWRCA